MGQITFPKGLTRFWFHMRKLNGSNVITGFQPILCSHYAACVQEMDQNPIDKKAAILRLKNIRKY